MASASPDGLFADLDPRQRQAALAALAQLQAGAADAARRAFEALLDAGAKSADLWRLTGLSQRAAGRHERGLRSLRQARALAPGDPLAAASLGLALLDAGAGDAALAELRRACTLAPQAAALHNNLGKALIDCGRPGEAIAPLHTALTLEPRLDRARFSLAHALTVTGALDAAAREYRHLLRRRPRDGEAWIGLAQLKSGQLAAGDIRALEAALHSPPADVHERAALEFALAEARHEQGHHAAAFAAWQAANARLRAVTPWDAAAFRRRVEAALTHPWPVAPAPTGTEAIFIVGLPRSGTSLVERILACHPRVHAGGELELLPELVGARGAAGFPQACAGRDAAAWRAAGTEYRRRAAVPADRVGTDKLPGNWLYAGAALAMLPGARIIVCRRDPVETGFSCWRHRFARGQQAFALDFASIGAFWRAFDHSCSIWRERWPQRVTEVSLETLTARPEPVIRALLAFCDLDWDAACLRPERGTFSAHTLSAAQLRRPIRATPPLAPRYGALLDPLRAALAGTQQAGVRA